MSNKLINDLEGAKEAIREHCSAPDGYQLIDYSDQYWQIRGDEIGFDATPFDINPDGEFNYAFEFYGGAKGFNGQGMPLFRGKEIAALLVTDWGGREPFLALFLNKNEIALLDDGE